MESILPYLLNTVLGAGGAWLTNMLKKNNLSMPMNLLSGAVGGNVIPLIVQAIMGADSSTMIMNSIMALVGGGLGSFIGGMVSKTPAT